MHHLYVSLDGDDANSGTQNSPLRTLFAARDAVRALIRDTDSTTKGDITVHLGPGVHRLSETMVLGPQDGGDGEVSVTWQGDESNQTQISSGFALDGWQPCGDDVSLPSSVRGKVWFVDLPKGTRVNTVYDAEGTVPRARGEAIKPGFVPLDNGLIDGKSPRLWGPDGERFDFGHMVQGDAMWLHDRFKFSEGDISPADDLHEAECLIIPANQWTMNVLPVSRVDFETGIAYMGQNCTYPIGVPACAPNGSIWLENSLSLIKPGSWVYHASTARLYYCPQGDAPEKGLEAACLTEFIKIEGRHSVTDGADQPARNIHLSHITFTRSNRFSFHGLTGKGIQHDWEMYDAPSCMVRLRHASACSIRRCTFTQGCAGGVRMDLASRNNRVENSEFSHLGGCGVVLCGYGLSRHYANRDNKVVHNYFHHIGESYWHCPAIFIWQSGNNHIAHNHLHDTPYTAIVCSGRSLYDPEGICECSGTVYWDDIYEQCGKDYIHNVWHYGGLPSWWMREPLMHSRDNLIEYNRIHDVMQTMGDGNGIYISGAGGGNVARFNMVGPCPSPTMAEGIRCDDDQHHTILHGNLIFAQHGHATGITLKGVNRVTNNVLALPLKRPDRGMLSLETGPLNGSVIKHNIIYTAEPDHTFVSEMRIHGQGRKARLCDTDSDKNMYYCSADESVGKDWLQSIQQLSIDVDSLAQDPGFVNAQAGDFNMKPDARALAIGFQPLPIDTMLKAGIQD